MSRDILKKFNFFTKREMLNWTIETKTNKNGKNGKKLLWSNIKWRDQFSLVIAFYICIFVRYILY